MMNLRKLSVLAITALLVTGISGVSVIAGTAKAATTTTSLTTTSLTTTSLTDIITSLINSVGDDTFSTIDLTTLVNTVTLTASTLLHLQTSAALAQPYRITMAAPSSSGTSTQHYGPLASGSPDFPQVRCKPQVILTALLAAPALLARLRASSTVTSLRATERGLVE